MPKLLLILFTLPLLCCDKDKNQQTIQAEICDSLCENEKIKVEYQKKFGVPISDIELSTTNVVYNKDSYHPQISVTRTASGAVAKYGNNELGLELLELEFNTEDWLDFINALHKCDIMEWIKISDSDTSNVNQFVNKAKDLRLYSEDIRKVLENIRKHNLVLEITLSSETHKLVNTEYNSQLTAWEEFKKMMENLEARLIKEGTSKLESKLRTEHEKRFGAPITDIELSTKKVSFRYYGKLHPYLKFSVFRTTTGAFIEEYDDGDKKLKNIELDMGDWLDFLNALHKCNIDRWEKDYNYEHKYTGGDLDSWYLYIHSSNKDVLGFSGISDYPPNWDEFMKVIDDFAEKIKAKAVY
jgi:hypothetical protein